MTQSTEERRRKPANRSRQPLGPDDAKTRGYHELLVRAAYDRCHPDDTFEDLKHRAGFSKEDRGLLGDWMAIARERAQQEQNNMSADITRSAIAA